MFSPSLSFLAYDGYSLLYDYKTRGICHASTRTSNMRRLRSVWLISTFGENYYVFIYLVNLKKITFGENKHINDKLLRLCILLVSLLT